MQGIESRIVIPKRKRDAAPTASPALQLWADQAALTSPAPASLSAVSWPRMKARRIGLMTNSAISAAVALSATAITNTDCQPYLADTRLASGTSSEAVPLAV